MCVFCLSGLSVVSAREVYVFVCMAPHVWCIRSIRSELVCQVWPFWLGLVCVDCVGWPSLAWCALMGLLGGLLGFSVSLSDFFVPRGNYLGRFGRSWGRQGLSIESLTAFLGAFLSCLGSFLGPSGVVLRASLGLLKPC